VRDAEEGAVADEGHAAELGDGSSGRPTETRRRRTLSMLTTTLCYAQYRLRSIARGEENELHVLYRRESLRDVAGVDNEVQLERELLRKVAFHNDDVVDTELYDILDLILG
jgi:hypothetical protein